MEEEETEVQEVEGDGPSERKRAARRVRGCWRELEEGGGGWFKQWWEWAELRRVMTP